MGGEKRAEKRMDDKKRLRGGLRSFADGEMMKYGSVNQTRVPRAKMPIAVAKE